MATMNDLITAEADCKRLETENARIRLLLQQTSEYLDELVRPQGLLMPVAQFWARGVELEGRIRDELRK